MITPSGTQIKTTDSGIIFTCTLISDESLEDGAMGGSTAPRAAGQTSMSWRGPQMQLLNDTKGRWEIDFQVWDGAMQDELVLQQWRHVYTACRHNSRSLQRCCALFIDGSCWNIDNKSVATVTWTATWLPHDCHMTATWLPHDCHMTATWLPHDCHMTATWLPQWLPLDCHMTATCSGVVREGPEGAKCPQAALAPKGGIFG